MQDINIKNYPFRFEKPVLIYLPCYNCENEIGKTISEIPKELYNKIECIVIDNCSTDNTEEVVKQEIRKEIYPFRINFLRTEKNYGYAGSQKIAYLLASQSPDVKHVIMLHGDGQYPPFLLTKFIPYFNKNYAIVDGYRHKRAYPNEEETPYITYSIIKILSWIETFITGYFYKEWHSGFCMYSTDFLRKIPIQCLSNTMHIDGEFLLCAGILGERTQMFQVYKRYKEHKVFRGLPRMKYIVDVFKIMWRFKMKYYHKMLKLDISQKC